MKPLVSLILTTLNNSDLLPLTLASIFDQDYPHLEIVIKDGGSTDGTLDIIKEAAAHRDITWTSGPDKGIYDAMNQGYELSSGSIVAFFNDQFATTDAVSKLVAAIDTAGDCIGAHADLVYVADGRVVRFWRTGDGNIYQGWLPAHPTMFLKREVYEKYGLYNTDFRLSSDYEYMIRILKDKQNKLAYIPKVLVEMFYGGSGNNSLGAYWLSMREGHQALRMNGIRGALLIDARRILLVAKQFFVRGR